MPPNRAAAIQRTYGDIDMLRTLTSSLADRGVDTGDRLLDAALQLLRQRTHRLFLLEWPSGAP